MCNYSNKLLDLWWRSASRGCRNFKEIFTIAEWRQLYEFCW